jgi:hypothetical protein
LDLKFWDRASCVFLWKNSQNFGDTYRLYLQGRSVRQARNDMKQAENRAMLTDCFMAFTGLHGVISGN